MPDLIRHPVTISIPAPGPDFDPGCAGMTAVGYFVAGLIIRTERSGKRTG